MLAEQNFLCIIVYIKKREHRVSKIVAYTIPEGIQKEFQVYIQKEVVALNGED